MEAIIDMMMTEKPAIVVLDSFQMVMGHKLTSIPDALNQMQLCASMFIKAVKEIGAIGILVGHITRMVNNSPKILRHMVDVILFFEVKVHVNSNAKIHKKPLWHNQ